MHSTDILTRFRVGGLLSSYEPMAYADAMALMKHTVAGLSRLFT